MPLPHDRSIATSLLETSTSLVMLWFNVTFRDISACSVKGQMSSFQSLTCCEEPTSWVARDILVLVSG